jgi:VanZ family protein
MNPITDEHRFWTPVLRRVVLVGYLLILLGGTHWPSELRGLQTDHLDKLVHFAAFAVLGWLAAWASESAKTSSIERAAVVLFAIALFAAVDEITQPYVGRKCDPLDWVADVAGAIAGLAAYSIAFRRKSLP